jgi:hypothetical protein
MVRGTGVVITALSSRLARARLFLWSTPDGP